MEKLEQRIGYVFRDKSLLTLALTHCSYWNENRHRTKSSNERLEFLGDAIMEAVTSDYLYGMFSDKSEGDLTRMRSHLVNNERIGDIAEGLGLNEFLMLSRGESASTQGRKILLANAFEAIVGAVFLDGGYERAEKFVYSLSLSKMSLTELQGDFRDPKSRLQESVQAVEAVTPTYRVLETTGPDHDKKFCVGVFIGTFQAGVGKGSSVGRAEAAAASDALRRYE